MQICQLVSASSWCFSSSPTLHTSETETTDGEEGKKEQAAPGNFTRGNIVLEAERVQEGSAGGKQRWANGGSKPQIAAVGFFAHPILYEGVVGGSS